MESSTALKILSALGDGIDPQTGEVLGTQHVCQQAGVIGALKLAVVALEQLSGGKKREKAKTGIAGVGRMDGHEKQLVLEI